MPLERRNCSNQTTYKLPSRLTRSGCTTRAYVDLMDLTDLKVGRQGLEPCPPDYKSYAQRSAMFAIVRLTR